MHRIDADCCYRHRTLRVCWTHLRALQKRLNRSRCCLGRQTRVGQGTKHSMSAHWRQLANTIERPVHSSDAVLCWRSRRRHGVNATAVRACQQYKMASSRTLLEELTKLRRSPTPRTLGESFPARSTSSLSLTTQQSWTKDSVVALERRTRRDVLSSFVTVTSTSFSVPGTHISRRSDMSSQAHCASLCLRDICRRLCKLLVCTAAPSRFQCFH